ncbi:MAG: NAD-dependent epimerase/dehydratase family protein, partial [Hyphomicrobiales bacterium]
MSSEPAKAQVLVTGADGYIAGWIVKLLLEGGHVVNAAVVDAADEARLFALEKLAETATGKLSIFEANLLNQGAYAEAMADCSLVFHTASPFTMKTDNPQRDLVDPALLGTRNVLNQAMRTHGVKKVVLTSSAAAIFGDNADLESAKNGAFSEKDWNTSSSLEHQPYFFSKTVAEREAWRFAEGQSKWELVTINPVLVLGPAFNPNPGSESFHLIRQLGDGTMKWGLPDFPCGIVDVRDVANAHVQAAFNPAAHGRYLISGHDTSLFELAGILRTRFGDEYPLPKSLLPKWFMWMIGPLADSSMTRRRVARNAGWPFRADSSKSVRELGITYRAAEETITEMFAQMIEQGMFKKT